MNLLSGQVLSNRMYLWRHRGFDPAIKKQYSENFTVFNNLKVSGVVCYYCLIALFLIVILIYLFG